MTTQHDTAVDAGRHGPPIVSAEPAQLAARILTQLHGDDRFILGLTGPPGTGKSTVVAAIAEALHPRRVAVVPMDGFHLANAVIRGTPLQSRKGAIDTFDAAGYAHLIRRLHQRDEAVVYAPSYVITEGNYLLSTEPEWAAARAAMDQVWYLDTPDHLRLQRLTDRHIDFGKTAEHAAAWAGGTDETNARAIAQTRDRADLILQGT
jgi:pantothenate kinase